MILGNTLHPSLFYLFYLPIFSFTLDIDQVLSEVQTYTLPTSEPKKTSTIMFYLSLNSPILASRIHQVSKIEIKTQAQEGTDRKSVV